MAPRDIVSQSIVSQMEKTRAPNVYLDLNHLDANHVRNRFPGIAKTCAEFGIDITKDQIPVRPGAHYMVGGVTVNEKGETTLPGLWAAEKSPPAAYTCQSSGFEQPTRGTGLRCPCGAWSL